jgi:hypothetical protein
MAKIIKMMGISKHPQRICIARWYISLNTRKYKWEKKFDNTVTSVRICLNMPSDIRSNEKYIRNEIAEYLCGNYVLSYIWLNSIFPQEKV